ncbi:innexin-11-like isoform X1 [Ostrea edulis]|uniref:innexin-11-like isoform X1 n=1 Tax=Ostrea edulis TaxID=37623 RepID=UPI0024AFFA53|nr:innexin-11-like isoform X1 [Ostrea edulis]
MIQLQGIGSRRAQRNLSMSSESWVDTLNGRWTPLLFLVLGIIAFFVPLWFSPLECMFPAEFSTQEIAYGKSRCYEATRIRNFPHRGLSENLHFKPPEVTTANRDSEGQRTLYQYVSIILIVQAFFLRIPFNLWKLGEKRLGIHFIVGSENQGEGSKYVGKRIAAYLEQWIKNRKVNILSIGAFTFFHFFIKILYFVSVCVHYGLLDSFLKQENETSFGSQLLGNIRENNISVFQTSPVFPRYVMCSYSIRRLTNIMGYTVQCNLPLNPYLELIMAVVWWWLVFSIAVIVADGVFYLFGALIPYFRIWFVEANLMKRELEISTQMLTDQQIWKFANNTLGEDVIAFLQQMQANNNGCVVMETVTELWKIYHGGVQSSPMGNPLLPEASCPGQTFQASRPGVELQHIDRGPGVPEGYTAQGQVTAQQSIYPAYPATVYKT